MKQFATMMMFVAWLLYGAMPAMATMPMSGQSMGAGAVMADHAVSTHSSHEGMTGEIVHSGQPDNMQQSCPHGDDNGKTICVAPFCSACLVIPPHIVFADSSRFIHRYPAPETEPSLMVSDPAPLTPPPRA